MPAVTPFESKSTFNTLPRAEVAGVKVVSKPNLAWPKVWAISSVIALPSYFFVHGSLKSLARPIRASLIFISTLLDMAPSLELFFNTNPAALMSTLVLPALNGFNFD